MFIDWVDGCLVSVSMAVDCMTVGAADGIEEPKMRKRKLFFIALVFGLMQGLMPVIGYFIGYSFRKQMETYIPWIAFTLLTLLAIKNIIEWFKERREKQAEKKNIEGDEGKKANVETKKKLDLKNILFQGVATSIDALCIGFVYLNYSIPQALTIFSLIAVITFVLSSLAIFLGKKIGPWLTNWAGLIAGIIFFLTGLKILLESVLGGGRTPADSSTVAYASDCFIQVKAFLLK